MYLGMRLLLAVIALYSPKYDIVLKNLSVNYFKTGNYETCITALNKVKVEDDPYLINLLESEKNGSAEKMISSTFYDNCRISGYSLNNNSRLVIISFKDLRCTIKSRKPCSSKNSLR